MTDGILQRLYRALFTRQHEKPCGCSYQLTSAPISAKFAPQTTERDHELVTVSEREYTNCTKREQEWRRELRCDNCGAEYVVREPSGRSVDYGAKNPDADTRLELDHMRPSPFGGYSISYSEVPEVRSDD